MSKKANQNIDNYIENSKLSQLLKSAWNFYFVSPFYTSDPIKKGFSFCILSGIIMFLINDYDLAINWLVLLAIYLVSLIQITILIFHFLKTKYKIFDVITIIAIIIADALLYFSFSGKVL